MQQAKSGHHKSIEVIGCTANFRVVTATHLSEDQAIHREDKDHHPNTMGPGATHLIQLVVIGTETATVATRISPPVLDLLVRPARGQDGLDGLDGLGPEPEEGDQQKDQLQ